jgi:hypothetical protein
MDAFSLNFPPCCHISPPYIMGFHNKEFKPHDRTHHDVIIVIIVIIVMLTLCYSKMSHATLILYYHAFMLTLHTFFISHELWLPQA